MTGVAGRSVKGTGQLVVQGSQRDWTARKSQRHDRWTNQRNKKANRQLVIWLHLFLPLTSVAHQTFLLENFVRDLHDLLRNLHNLLHNFLHDLQHDLLHNLR